MKQITNRFQVTTMHQTTTTPQTGYSKYEMAAGLALHMAIRSYLVIAYAVMTGNVYFKACLGFLVDRAMMFYLNLNKRVSLVAARVGDNAPVGDQHSPDVNLSATKLELLITKIAPYLGVRLANKYLPTYGYYWNDIPENVLHFPSSDNHFTETKKTLLQTYLAMIFYATLSALIGFLTLEQYVRGNIIMLAMYGYVVIWTTYNHIRNRQKLVVKMAKGETIDIGCQLIAPRCIGSATLIDTHAESNARNYNTEPTTEFEVFGNGPYIVVFNYVDCGPKFGYKADAIAYMNYLNKEKKDLEWSSQDIYDCDFANKFVDVYEAYKRVKHHFNVDQPSVAEPIDAMRFNTVTGAPRFDKSEKSD